MPRRFRRPAHGRSGLALCALLLLPVGELRAGPEPLAAGRELLCWPARVAGDLLGGSGSLAAGSLSLVADGVALIDRAPGVSRVLRGAGSGTLRRIAFGISWVGGRGLELLRGEDVERLPEPAVAFTEAAPGYGRVALLGSGFAALGLALRDAALGPAIVGTRALGAGRAADALLRSQREARIVALGPSP